MPRSLGFAIDIKPIKGVVTEYTKLAFPEQAALEADNVVFFKNALEEGVSNVSCRPALEYSSDWLSFTGNSIQGVRTWFEWDNPSQENTEDSILVIQEGNLLLFFIVDNTFPNAPFYVLDLDPYRGFGAPSTATRKCSFTEAKGYLFVAHPYCNPLRLEFVAPSTINVVQLTIEVRDTSGLDDGLDFTTRPTTLSPEHHYNLLNQGWDQNKINNVFATHNFYPSNADIWWMYKDVNDNFSAPRMVGDSYLNLNMPAPKGWFILNAFVKDRSFISGIPGLPIESSGFMRPGAIAHYAGRIWYGAPSHKDYYGKVYFSQTLEDIDQASKCYSVNDPTSEYLNDVLDTDGGVIDIGDTGEIFHLVPFGHGLLVIAEQGVWLISGPQGSSFKPTDFSVQKISGVVTNYKSFVVKANGVPYWWTENSIYSCIIDQVGNINIVSITDDTIKSLYNSIPLSSKQNFTGAFDYNSQTCIWLYKDSNNKDRYLLFNVKEKTFSLWSSDTDFSHLFSLKNKTLNQTIDGKPPTLFNTFLCEIENNQIRFSEFKRKDNTLDYGTQPFSCYFTVGYRIHGGLVRQFQNPYIFIYLNNTPNTYLKFTAYWNFYKASSYPSIAQTQEMRDNPFFDPYTVIKKRMRIRGRGDSVVFRFENEPGFIFDLLGFGTRELVEGDS